MEKYLSILQQLRKLSGNEQLNYLNSVKDENLKSIMDYTYNPSLMYKIDEGKFFKVSLGLSLIKPKLKSKFTIEDWQEFAGMLDDLSLKRAVTDAEVRKVKRFIISFQKGEVQEFLCGVLFKDLKLNLGVKKLQTIWEDFCDAPQVQLAEDYDGRVFESGLYSRKFDGKRMYFMDGVAYSRYNRKYKPAPIQHIIDQLSTVGQFLVYDGEVLYFNPDGTEDFKKAISLTSSDERTPECDNLYFVIFDQIWEDEFKRKQTTVEFEISHDACKRNFEAKDSDFGCSVFSTKLPNILIARQEPTKDMLQMYADLYGWEGLMYRNAKSPYLCKRTNNLMRIKPMKDAEFTLTGMEIGTGVNSNRLGSLIVDVEGSEVHVGTGFSELDRETLWHNKELFLSPQFTEKFKVKVKFQEKTSNKKGGIGLRHPTFLCFRDENDLELSVQEALKGVENEK